MKHKLREYLKQFGKVFHEKCGSSMVTADGKKIPQRTKQEKNIDYCRKRSRAYRLQALIVLGGCCKKCSYDDLRALHIDHVYGDGASERKRQKQVYKAIALRTTSLNRYQLLCANCNWIKRIMKDVKKKSRNYGNFLLRATKKLRKQKQTAKI